MKLALLLLSLCGALHAQDTALLERARGALPYLGSGVPELRRGAEVVVENAAPKHFEALENELPGLPRPARQSLFRILAGTDHSRRIPLCVNMLCDPDVLRMERIHAWRALLRVPADELLRELERRLAEETAGDYRRVQLCGVLGTLSSARAQGLAEAMLEKATPGSMLAFAAEDAALRSTFAGSFGQPAWARYQARRAGAPKATLRQLLALLDDLAQPRASDRAEAARQLTVAIGGDERVLLALARSPLPERAAFALTRLAANPPRELALAAQAVMLDLTITADQTVALLAMDVGIAGRPPTSDELEQLRPIVGRDAMARFESILEGMARGGNLADLRDNNRRLSARLRPLLLRRGPADPEVRQLSAELGSVRARLQALEQVWANGWRREFESSILAARED
ncbi:MAG: hypothetical protein KF696_09320 [Planctomycetes bacterium]|nr:hypothetical protein [Planctomycetota bacterium]MCW8136786.1 hypothetical protein [Planctomycetota bacterium]